MADLKFDTADFDTAISKYNAIAKELESIKDGVETAMANLKGSWQSTAGNAFEDLYNDNWAKHVDQYISVLEKLAELLGRAKTDYQELEDSIPKMFS